MASDDTEKQESDFLKKIEENRRRNKELMEKSMADFYKEFPDMKEQVDVLQSKPKTEIQKYVARRKTMDPTFSVAGIKRRRNADMTPTRRSARLSKSDADFNNENKAASNDEDNYSSSDSNDSDSDSKPRKRRRRVSEPPTELKKNPRRRVTGSRASQVPELPVDKVDDRLISKIARRSKKVYDSVNGTTCHQCRQKTTDTKSVCRSGSCVGVRGMFCGVCLKNRYGEDVAEVLKDPNWSCPPCRGDCNCSICRTRLGKMPTGIMVPFIREKGYAHLREYLNRHPEDDE
ncbi:hypothetical protein LSTR_LSTR007994 [Laodelphax striatellus]|uniref:Zinc-finger domain-containing protein n=1 Tax=Laodelphax striatellus TaxID=195883 RepID=A0A482X4Q2_LAOST|nr:hypothetical protein LSTR_LSTR007994 [Laodelphax striatellus]